MCKYIKPKMLYCITKYTKPIIFGISCTSRSDMIKKKKHDYYGYTYSGTGFKY